MQITHGEGHFETRDESSARRAVFRTVNTESATDTRACVCPFSVVGKGKSKERPLLKYTVCLIRLAYAQGNRSVWMRDLNSVVEL